MIMMIMKVMKVMKVMRMKVMKVMRMRNIIKTVTAITALCVVMGFLNPAMAAPRNSISRNPILRIHPGMTYTQVRHVLGTPTSKVFLSNNHEQWVYSKRGYNGRPYHSKVIEFKRSRVIGFFDKKPTRHRSYHRHPHQSRHQPRHLCRNAPRPVLQLNLGF